MPRASKLNYTIDRFNQGYAFFERAATSWAAGNMLGYETALRKAATEAVGSLEWALKIYLRLVVRTRGNTEDQAKLKHPTFDDLMTLMRKYANPPLDNEMIEKLYDYRESLRNSAEHDATVPASDDLRDAMDTIRKVLLIYLPVEEHELKQITPMLSVPSEILELKDQYFKTLITRYEYMDLGGISPRVGGKIVRIRMRDIFIPLYAVEDAQLVEPFPSALAEDAQESWNTTSDDTGDQLQQIVTDLWGPTDDEQHPPVSRWHGSRHPKRLDLSAILSTPQCVILGHPGSGKTTIGKYVCYSIAVGGGDIIDEALRSYVPVVIRAAEYAAWLKSEPALSFHKYIIEKDSVKFGGLFEWALQNGSCMVIIDGLDEIADPQLRVTTSKRIERFVSEFYQNHFLITSRIVGYRQNQLAGDFTHITLTPIHGRVYRGDKER